VMPVLGKMEIESAREAILRIFLEHVIGGKGLSANPDFERMVKMPTPEAVLEATRLLSHGTPELPGVGDVMVVDVGGATTDVHSDRTVEAVSPGIEDPLLPPPATLRTVEGDLGLRTGAAGALAADGRWVESESDEEPSSIRQAVLNRGEDPAWIPGDERASRLDGLLAVSCATHAIVRHCGTMLLTPGMAGPPTLVRDGPDLRELSRIIGTGGVFAHRSDGLSILERALGRKPPRSLAPREPRVGFDRNYVLAAAGLLSTHDREAAMRLLLHELDSADDGQNVQ
jgi:uncharacterized protein (TIGR01319 family)